MLNFFRAEAERRKAEAKIPSIIYAIEEPETSQHTEHQKKMIKAFLDLSKTANTQVIITTHSAESTLDSARGEVNARNRESLLAI